MAVLEKMRAAPPPSVTEPPEGPSRKRLWMAVVSSAAVLIVIGIVIGIVNLTTGSSPDEIFSPEQYRTGGATSEPAAEIFSPEQYRTGGAANRGLDLRETEAQARARTNQSEPAPEIFSPERFREVPS